MKAPERLAAIAAKPHRLLLGLMSGMSVDGLDLALIRVEGLGEQLEVDLVAHATAGYEAPLAQAIRSTQTGSAADVARLDFDLAERWAADIERFLAEAGVAATDVDAIGSHGQTLFHQPRTDHQGARTLQVGRGDVLAARTGILTVFDFRPADIAAGGEGAPLIPMADWILFGGRGATTACQNLGSIANVTVLPASVDEVQAFDTGPANTLIDSFARMAGEDMDRDGRLSAQGQVDDDVLLTLYTLRAPWLMQLPPKSAGYGTFGPALAEEVRARHPDTSWPDLVRTAAAFSAGTLVEAYEQFILTRFPDLRVVRFSGGGCHNPTLMSEIRKAFRRPGLTVATLDQAWIDSKEAIGFALLADRTLRGLPGNVPAATGADAPAVLGTIAFGA